MGDRPQPGSIAAAIDFMHFAFRFKDGPAALTAVSRWRMTADRGARVEPPVERLAELGRPAEADRLEAEADELAHALFADAPGWGALEWEAVVDLLPRLCAHTAAPATRRLGRRLQALREVEALEGRVPVDIRAFLINLIDPNGWIGWLDGNANDRLAEAQPVATLLAVIERDAPTLWALGQPRLGLMATWRRYL